VQRPRAFYGAFLQPPRIERPRSIFVIFASLRPGHLFHQFRSLLLLPGRPCPADPTPPAQLRDGETPLASIMLLEDCARSPPDAAPGSYGRPHPPKCNARRPHPAEIPIFSSIARVVPFCDRLSSILFHFRDVDKDRRVVFRASTLNPGVFPVNRCNRVWRHCRVDQWVTFQRCKNFSVYQAPLHESYCQELEIDPSLASTPRMPAAFVSWATASSK